MASMCSSSFSSTLTLVSSLNGPTCGSIDNICSKGPSFLIWRSWSRKSSRVKESERSFFSNSSAFLWSMASSAFSIKERTSPIPRMRETRRSGWKSSRASYFSPTPTNFMGWPVTVLIDKAAPPLASPSNLVKITPVRPSWLWNSWALLTASWPVMASATNKISDGLANSFTFRSSCMSCSSMWSRPAVSINRTS